jgi:hypothetical protein
MRKALWIALALLAVTGRAEAGWEGPWQVEGAGGWRHVGGPDAALILEGRIGGLDARLEGRGDARGFWLQGTLSGIVDDAWVERATRLDARPSGTDALDVTLTREGAPPARERWRRPRPARLRVEAPSRYDPASGDLTFDIIVEGRPQAVVVMVVAAEGEYARLGGVVEHLHVALGEALPVGRHRVAWSGKDRGLDGQPILPGEYRLVVTTAEDAVGPPPGVEGDPLTASVTLTVDGAPAPVVVVAPGRDGPAPGLAGSVRPATRR